MTKEQTQEEHVKSMGEVTMDMAVITAKLAMKDHKSDVSMEITVSVRDDYGRTIKIERRIKKADL